MYKLIISFLFLVLPSVGHASYDSGYSELSVTELSYFNKQVGHLKTASIKSGISVPTLAAIANIESGLGKDNYNSKSGATGVMQYTKRTWKHDVTKHGKALGLASGISPANDKASILVGGMGLADNKAFLSQYSNNVTDGDLYISHLVGLYGAKAIIKGVPNAPITRYIKLRKGNGKLYYNKGKVATVQQFRTNINNLVNGERRKFESVNAKNNTNNKLTNNEQLDLLVSKLM